MLIDTHCHLCSSRFRDDEVDAIVGRAVDAGVTRIITIGTTVDDSRRNIALAERYEAVFATVGVHPTDVLGLAAEPDWLDQLQEMLAHPKVVAIGEVGLDYFHPPDSGTVPDYHALQAEVFGLQMELAAASGYNVVVHQRDSHEETVAAVQPFNGRLRAVFHCFTGTSGQAADLLAQGHLVSFTGIVTFRNALEVQHCAAAVPRGSFMVETDAPYLAPVPHRGKRCEPAHTRDTAHYLAQLRATGFEDLARETTATAEAFFRFP